MNTKLKILIISDYAYPAGGIEVFVDEIISFTKDLIEYNLLTWAESKNTKKRKELVPTIRVDCGDLNEVWQAFAGADLLFLQTSWNMRLLALLAKEFCKTNNKPLVTVIHTSSNSNNNIELKDYQLDNFKALIDASTKVVCVSNDVLESINNNGIRNTENDNKFTVIENATRFMVVNNRVEKTETVSFIGRPTHSKGMDIFLHLVDNLKDTNLKFKLNTVSLPPPENALNFSNIIEFKWCLQDNEMIDFYKTTDLLILPYRYADGMPLTILEALSFGIPIIGFKAPGVNEVLLKYNQTVLEINDLNGLTNTVRKWHEGKLAFPKPDVKVICTWEKQAFKYINLFNSIVND